MRWAIHANRRRTHSRYRNTGFGHTHNGHTLISSRLSQLGIPLAHAQPGELSPLARWLRCGDAPGSLAPAMGNATAPTDACPSSLLLSARLPAPAALLPPLLPPVLPPPCSPVVTPGALIPWNRRPARRYFARDRLVLSRWQRLSMLSCPSDPNMVSRRLVLQSAPLHPQLCVGPRSHF